MQSLAQRFALCVLLCAAAFSSGFAGPARGDDWPTYRHDCARTAISPETLAPPLAQHWIYRPPAGPAPGWGDPQPVPIEGNLELPRLRFDDAFHAVVAKGLLFFGSSADNKVYCLDAATGRPKWDFFTGGPVRLAPTVADGRVYVGSDDGFAYCLDASTGAVVWKVRGGPSDERVLGHGRMISLWPIRTSVLVDGGTAYFAAGIFPGERIYVHAVRASDGAPVWTNDTMSDRENGRNGFSPQGYLLASPTTLFVATGRNMPAAFSRADGSYLYQSSGNWRSVGVVGGTYAFLEGEQLYSGTESLVFGVNAATGKLVPNPYPAKRLVVSGQGCAMLTGTGIQGIDPGLADARAKVATLEAKRRALLDAKPKPADLDQQLKKLDAELMDARKAAEVAVKWTLPERSLSEMVVAGSMIFAGGAGRVLAADRATGKLLWQGKIEGTARGLAVAGGRLYVSTDTGAIHCFGSGSAPRGAVAFSSRPSMQYPQDDLTRLCRSAADAIVRRTGVSRGYCLVLGCPSGRLAYELARRTQLSIYVVDPNPARVAKARALLDAAGLYGTRVTVDEGSYDALPYSDYFANLVVSEETLVSGKLPVAAGEVLRVLKPCGGVLCLGQPASPGKAARPLAEAALQGWLAGGAFRGAQVANQDGLWATFRRGELEGAGSWTHQYADAGNTAASTDTLVKAPFGVLWYGEPGPNKVPSRHLGNVAPLSIDGRVYLQGENRIMCFDSYNGQPYWERQIPGAYRVGMVRECSNLALNADSLFLGAKDHCLRLDNRTGATLGTYPLPKVPEPAVIAGSPSLAPRARGARGGKPAARQWSYMAVVGDTLFGSIGAGEQWSSTLFALDVRTGKLRWMHQGKKIRNNSIAISEGRIFFADDRATSAQRQEALKPQIDELVAKQHLTAAAAEKKLASADVRVVVALDAATGALAWERPVDLTDCGMHVLTGMAAKGVLVFVGSHPNGHYWPQFLAGEYAARRAVALSTQDGSVLWSKAIGYRLRPIIIGDTLVAEPWAFDLHTGEQKMRENPVTGEQSPWQFERPGHHCGTISGAPNTILFRSYCYGYYDMIRDMGTEHWAGQRPGCWINMIPANGLVVVPEASSGCVCLFSIHCTTVLKPRTQEKAWGMFSDRAPVTPVKHLAINLGGPGDRRDAAGKLWLSYPRPSARMQLPLKMQIAGLPGGAYYYASAETSPVAGTDVPWAFSSGYAGLTKCSLPLVQPGDGAALYTVRLGFADLENAQAGRRVFDIKLQGQTVARDFDVVAAAGGKDRAVTREFKGVTVDGDLSIELVPKEAKPEKDQLPILSTVEVERERALHVGMQATGVTLSDMDREQPTEVSLANYTNREFVGTLQIQAPEGFQATPAKTEVKLAVGARQVIPLKLAVTAKGKAANLEARALLISASANNATETERPLKIDYLGPRARMVVQAAADTYVSKGSPSANFGHAATLLVDGGNAAMGDNAYNVGYLRFPLKVPGKVVSVALRIHTSPAEASESSDSGGIYLVTDAWDENTITFANRPKPGKQVGTLGSVKNNAWEERKLTVDLAGLKELSLALVPTTTDGAAYITREGNEAPELVIEYVPE